MKDAPLTLPISTWNVKGLKDALKRSLIYLHIHRNPGIFLFQETHIPDTQIKCMFNKNFITHFKDGERRSKGLAMTIPNNNSHLTHFPPTFNNDDGNDRIQMGSIQWFDLKILIINIYAPSGNDVNERANFFDTVEHILNKCEEENVILAGDFNCVLDPKLDKVELIEFM